VSLDVVERVRIMDPVRRAAYFRSLDQRQRAAIDAAIRERVANPYFRFRDDPVGFMTHPQGLAETAWSRQLDIMRSVAEHPKTAVPACHAPGKSHIAARIIAWWGSVHPAGTARILTTATSYRQVKNVLWPYVRSVHGMHGLPGRMNLTEWRIGPRNDILAEGVKPPDEDEHALSGLHAPHVLIVVDEAGGISNAFGQSLIGLMTGSHTRLLLIGNPPVDEEGSWFEKQCEDPTFNVIPIPASATPNWTREDAGICKAHPEMAPHPVAEHLVDKTWAEDLVRSYGEGSAVVLARRDAVFPKNNESKVLPMMWLDAASVDDVGIPDQRRREGVIKLGVDIAAGGTDEFVIAQLDGNVLSVLHRSTGEQNAEPGFIRKTIQEHARVAAGKMRERGLGTVRVKVDTVGVGFGIYMSLREPEQAIAGVEYVEVSAGANAHDGDRFRMQRDEGWWALREAIQVDEHGRRELLLDLGTDTKARDKILAQLNAPKYTIDVRSKIHVESKDDMSKRGIASPDVADALWMAPYEPRPALILPAVGPIVVGGEGDADRTEASERLVAVSFG
jgi:hypothetical protein